MANKTDHMSVPDINQSEYTYKNYVKDSLFFQLLYADDFYLSEETFLNAGFCPFNNAIIIKVISFESNKNYNRIFELSKIFQSLFSEFSVYSLIEVPNKILFMISTKSADGNIFFKNIIDLLYNNMENSLNSGETPLTIAISKPLTSLNEVNSIIKASAHILKTTDGVSPNEIRYFNEFEASMPFGPSYDIYNLKQILSNLLDSNDGKKSIDTFIDTYRPKNIEFNKNSLKFFCFSTIASLQFLLTEQNIKLNNKFDNLDVLWAKLESFETDENIFEWLKETLLTYYEQTLRLKRKDKNDIVSRIQSYIDENYQTITSVEQVASVLFISCGYAKNIFKKHTGQTIYDYLIETRIDRAKKLLRGSSIKVYEVSELVGYVSKAHFTDVFKKKTGMTPKEYQLKASQDKKKWANKSEVLRNLYNLQN